MSVSAHGVMGCWIGSPRWPVELFHSSHCSTTGVIKVVICTFLCVGRKEIFYLTMHSTHFIYDYMATDIW